MLEIKNFSKFYGNKKVVENLSISVQSGDIYGFIHFYSRNIHFKKKKDSSSIPRSKGKYRAKR